MTDCCNCAISEHKDGTCVQCHHYALAKVRDRALLHVLSPDQEAAIKRLVKVAMAVVKVAQEEGEGEYQTTLDLVAALQVAAAAGLTEEE